MATLQNKEDKTLVKLVSEHIFGRHETLSHTVLIDISCSRKHATIRWDNQHWWISDSSSNGTFLNGKRLIRDKPTKLSLSDTITLGSSDINHWRVMDIAPPLPVLLPMTNTTLIIELGETTYLPDDVIREVSIFQANDGSTILKYKDVYSVLQAGDIVSCSGATWRFFPTTVVPETFQLRQKHDLNDAGNIHGRFDVSSCEEHISLSLFIGNQFFDVPSRSHSYLLLVLAKKRLDDINLSLPKLDQGWIDNGLLSKALGVDELTINTQISRARKQVRSALAEFNFDTPLIERRLGQTRIALTSIEVKGGFQNRRPHNSQGFC